MRQRNGRIFSVTDPARIAHARFGLTPVSGNRPTPRGHCREKAPRRQGIPAAIGLYPNPLRQSSYGPGADCADQVHAV